LPCSIARAVTARHRQKGFPPHHHLAKLVEEQVTWWWWVASDEHRSNIPKQLRWFVSYDSYTVSRKKKRLGIFADDFFWMICSDDQTYLICSIFWNLVVGDF